jgi:hypothetical protein
VGTVGRKRNATLGKLVSEGIIKANVSKGEKLKKSICTSFLGN